MLSELAASHAEVGTTFAEASELLGRDLWGMLADGNQALINQTENTQPLMLAAGVAVWRVWCKTTELRPSTMAGHSLGEFTALVCAGSVAFEEAVVLVRERARLMQLAVPTGAGAMAAVIGLDDSVVENVCANAAGSGIVAPVNFNAPGQVVIAGETAAVEQAISGAKEAGARRAVVLPVSVPSHCALMEPAAAEFRSFVDSAAIATPQIPVIHNVDAVSHSETDLIRDVLVRQLHNPVRWVQGIRAMHDQGISTFVECGPGKVLTGLNKRIVKGCDALPLHDEQTLGAAVEFIQ